MKKTENSIDYLSKKLVGYEFAQVKKKKQLYIKNTKFGNSRQYFISEDTLKKRF